MISLIEKETEQQVIQHFNDLDIIGVGLVTDTNRVLFHKKSLAPAYFTIEPLSSGTIYWKMGETEAAASSLTISYSKDNGNTWSEITSTQDGAPISVNAGDKVMFKGNNSAYGFYSDEASMSFAERKSYFDFAYGFNVFGNIMSLVYGDNFSTATTFSGTDNFGGFFAGTNVVDAGNLILPATAMTRLCYECMFSGCTSLTTAPALPATTMAQGCYSNMFASCTHLTAAQSILPATTLSGFCYSHMFLNCTALTTAPALPATTLYQYCYAQMFYNCTSLTTAPALPATTLDYYCYDGMFNGCTSLTTAPELPATTLTGYCYQSMFNGCTSLTTAPALPATTLTYNCYSSMFANCTNLNYIKCLATDITAGYCTTDWVNGVASTGTFVKSPSMTSWTTGKNGIPSGWTVQNA